MHDEQFNRLAGITVQAEQIARWATVLQPHLADKLTDEAIKRNDKLTAKSTGFDVWRGGQIDEFVHNYLMRAPSKDEQQIINRRINAR